MKIGNPLVSCILATADRPEFLKQAIKYFQGQKYEPKELIVIDDGNQSSHNVVVPKKNVRYLRLPKKTVLGEKLNIGIRQAEGEIIQKIDDDDYYSPNFLNQMVKAILGADRNKIIACLGSFLVLVSSSGFLVFSGTGWSAGGTLCFSKKLWGQHPFRTVPRAVDWWFIKDHGRSTIKVSNPELYIMVRHSKGHTWTHLGNSAVENYFSRMQRYHKRLTDLMDKEDVEFYESLRL